MLATRGIGNILTAPISTALQGHGQVSASVLTNRGMVKTGFDVAGGHYGAMITYSGACFAAATVVSLVGWALERRR